MPRRHRVRGGGGRFTPRPEKSGFFTDSLGAGLLAYGAAIPLIVIEVMREWGKDAVDLMQSEAPWQDRTGDARNLLGFSVDEDPLRPVVYLYHGVSYGVWLEIRFNGDYAIIMPTIEQFGPDLIRRLEEAL